MLRITSPIAEIARLHSATKTTTNTGYKVWNSSHDINLASRNHQEPRYHGFTKEQILKHCLNFFANETAHVTIEFLDSYVMQVKRVSRFTLMDQFGIIGNYSVFE